MFFSNRNKTKTHQSPFPQEARGQLVRKAQAQYKTIWIFLTAKFEASMQHQVCSKTMYNPENRILTSSVSQTKGGIDLHWFPPVNILSATYTHFPLSEGFKPFSIERKDWPNQELHLYPEKWLQYKRNALIQTTLQLTSQFQNPDVLYSRT